MPKEEEVLKALGMYVIEHLSLASYHTYQVQKRGSLFSAG